MTSLSRRDFLVRSGALVMSFSLSPLASAQEPPKEPKAKGLPGSLKDEPMLDAWIRVDADGEITVFTGKVELGQGIKTAFVQLAAEELIVEPQRIKLVTADTMRTANEGYTAGSHSMQDSGTAIRHAAAQVRELLVGLAASRWNVPPDRISVENGIVRADGRSLGYGELVAGQTLHVRAQAESKLRPANLRRLVGKPVQRIDIPGKVTGGVTYVQDLRLPGMVHGRVLRPPSYGARLRALDTSQVDNKPGVIKIVRDGTFAGVVTEREYQAVVALRALGKGATWDEHPSMPAQGDIFTHLQHLPSQEIVIHGSDARMGTGPWAAEATYRRPYQLHGSIGPSCAVAIFDKDTLTVWTHSQGVYPLRAAVAQILHLANEKVHCIHMEGSGCYGHNGADDVAADAALLARAVPGRPVRVQWMRDQEHAWEPFGPAMVTSAKAALDPAGNITAWQYDVWSNTHSTRPGAAGNLLAGRHLEQPFDPVPPKPIPQPEGGGDRNAIPLYALSNARVVNHFIPEMPLRISALRSLGAYMNVFSIESFMDELALAAHADPIEFRLRHTTDPRAREVMTTAAQAFSWSSYRRQQHRGRGFAFARYKNLAAYAAIALEVEIERETGRTHVVRGIAAVDSGEAVNPDGLRNQIEGGIIQSLSWSLYEEVTFDQQRITSRDWASYPILRFEGMPDVIDVHIIDRPGQPFLGTGEAAQGPTAAALANAFADATGSRLRELPFTAKRVKQAIGV